jgi:hypothetical protein
VNIQSRFYNALHISQNCCSTPNKMPYLCVVGTLDFDEMKAMTTRNFAFEEYKSCVNHRIAMEWTATREEENENFAQFRERIEQEEFWRVQADAVAVALAEDLQQTDNKDPRQLASRTETLTFCGCHCFRSLSVERGFYFA